MTASGLRPSYVQLPLLAIQPAPDLSGSPLPCFDHKKTRDGISVPVFDKHSKTEANYQHEDVDTPVYALTCKAAQAHHVDSRYIRDRIIDMKA